MLSTITAFSQESNTPILTVLKKIEKEFDVKFSYNRRDLKHIKISETQLQPPLQNVLATISARGDITFTQITDRYIAVRLNSVETISICGILIETESSSPIPDAEIKSNSHSTVSDRGGNFAIENIAVNETLSIFVNGFLTRSISVADLQIANTCPFIYVSQAYTYLPEVVLHNFITKGISKNVEGATVISNRNFDILPSLIEPDVLQIAQALPGIESADETAANLNVRGGTSDEFLILWDNIRMYQTGHFFGLISAFNPNLTKNVTIYKNGTAARYGEGVSGVIAMESNNEIPERIEGAIGVNMTSINGYAEIPASERFLIAVSGRASLNTGIGNPVYNEFFSKVFQNTVITNFQNNSTEGIRSTDEQFNFFDVSVKALWNITDRDELSYQLLTINNTLKFTELFVAESNSSSFESELEQQNTSNGVSWQRYWGEAKKMRSKISAFGSTYTRNEFTNNVDIDVLSSNQNSITEKGIKTELEYSASPTSIFGGGFQYIDTEITDAATSTENSTIATITNNLYANSFYLYTTLNMFDDKTTVTAGSRYTSYPSIDENFLEPRFHIDQKLTSTLRAQLSGELKHQSVYQTVNLKDNLLGVETRDWLLADGGDNPFLKSRQLGAGLNYQKKNWTISFDGFLKKVTGVNTQNVGFRNQLQDTRFIGSYRVKGIEFTLNKRAENFTIWLSYTYQKNKYIFPEFIPNTFRNQLDNTHSATIAGSYTYRNFNFSLGNTFKSGLPYTQPVSGSEIITTGDEKIINFEQPNAETLPSYFRSDFSASYETQLDETFSGKINIAFLNILNRKNALSRYYILEEDETGFPSLRQIDQFSLGFTPNISLQLLF